MKGTTTQDRLWTGSFLRICLVNLFIFVNFHALLPTFPFFVTYLGGDAVTIGLATALFSIASIVSRPFVGWLIDTRGRYAILVLGLIGMTLIPMGYFVSAGIATAVILRTAHGVFHAASSNASSTWVTDIIPHKRMGEGLGMYGLSMAISTAVAVTFCSFLHDLLIRCLYLLELFFRLILVGIIDIGIGMIFSAQGLICFFDFFLGSISAHPQDTIRIIIHFPLPLLHCLFPVFSARSHSGTIHRNTEYSAEYPHFVI